MMMNLCSSNGSSNGLGLSLIRGREERKPMVVALCVEMWGTRKHSPFTSLEPRVLVDISFAVQPQSCCRSTIRRGGLELAGGSQSSLRHTRGRRRLLLRSKLLHWKVREREREPRLERLLTLRSTYERRRITQPPPKKGPNRRRRRPPQYCKHTLAKVALLGPDDKFLEMFQAGQKWKWKLEFSPGSVNWINQVIDASIHDFHPHLLEAPCPSMRMTHPAVVEQLDVWK